MKRRIAFIVLAVVLLTVLGGCPSDLSEADTYTVTFDKQGGSGGSNSVIATIGQPMPTATAPSKAGLIFSGYYTGLNGAGARYYSARMESSRDWDLPANTELVAYWRPYIVGEPGPAGGFVFYDKGEFTDGWRYMEVWTSAEEGNHQWKTSNTWTEGTSIDIGSGYANTYTVMSGAEHPAAAIVRSATHGGFEDWFLPSRNELELIYENLIKQGVGAYTYAYHWTSSEFGEALASVLYFYNGNFISDNKTTENRVLAVRAF